MSSPRRVTLRIPRELVSPNRWNGRHWRMKHRLSQAWEKDIWLTMLVDGLPGRRWLFEGRKLVQVTREVPARRNFIRDPDNAMGACKPVLDALTRLGLIVDDSSTWLDVSIPEQRLSADGQHWTQIEIEPVEY